jgi:hypothetical protein
MTEQEPKPERASMPALPLMLPMPERSELAQQPSGWMRLLLTRMGPGLSFRLHTPIAM